MFLYLSFIKYNSKTHVYVKLLLYWTESQNFKSQKLYQHLNLSYIKDLKIQIKM